jgi:hypothetical protein
VELAARLATSVLAATATATGHSRAPTTVAATRPTNKAVSLRSGSSDPTTPPTARPASATWRPAASGTWGRGTRLTTGTDSHEGWGTCTFGARNSAVTNGRVTVAVRADDFFALVLRAAGRDGEDLRAGLEVRVPDCVFLRVEEAVPGAVVEAVCDMTRDQSLGDRVVTG